MTENKDYINFVNDLKSKIRQAQYKAYRAVNTELITLYWDIGQSIVAKQEELGWGQKIIQKHPRLSLKINLRNWRRKRNELFGILRYY